MGCGALAMRSGLPTASSKMSSIALETSIPTQRRGIIMGPVPVMRGLLAQPRATVQVEWSKRAGDRAGLRRHAPGTQRLPAHPIMTDLPHTGTRRRGWLLLDELGPLATDTFRITKTEGMGPGVRRADGGVLVGALRKF